MTTLPYGSLASFSTAMLAPYENAKTVDARRRLDVEHRIMWASRFGRGSD